MRCGKHGSWAKRVCSAIVLGGLIGTIALFPARAQEIHRNGFEGRQTAWLRGEDNVRAEEKAHNLSTEHAHQGVNSEFIQLVCPEGKSDNNYATYYYPTQPAPIGDDLTASIWLKADRAGVQLRARLVLPKERNPKQIDEPMTVILNGDTYKLTRRWQKLEISNPTKLMKDQQQILRAQLGRDINLADAYIDRLMINLYTGPGQIDAYIDDLEIGPVKSIGPPQTLIAPKDGSIPATLPKQVAPPLHSERVPVRFEANRLQVGGKPFFFRAIRYTDSSLKTLRDKGFNTIWFDANVRGDRIEEAIGHGFWIVPSLPLLGDAKPANGTLTSRGGSNDLATARDAEGLVTAIIRFLSGDAVLFWDCGGALQVEKADQLKRTAAAISLSDPNRPIGADVWDGFYTLSHYAPMVGTHRYPLMTSLELTKYRDWLMQRRQLTQGNTLSWTWVQTHVPDWQMQILCGKNASDETAESIGPQPEQIRLLTYLGLAAGCQGLTFSSDRSLDDSRQGRDRLLMMALLNQEINMIEPLLLTMRDTPTWIDTSNPDVKAAVMRSVNGILVLPIWLGNGAQYVPPQGAQRDLSITVPLVPDGAQPWEISPVRVQSLQYNSERKLGGTKIIIPQFDLTSAIVFTSDLSPTGLVVNWQNKSRQCAPQAAAWARELAAIELQKVRKTHAELEKLAPPVLNANKMLRDAEEHLQLADYYEKAREYPNSYSEAIKSLGGLRILMRAHWEQAVKTLDVSSASPYAVNFFTLPKHWELREQLHGMTAGANALRDGDFEAAAKLPEFVFYAKLAEELTSKLEQVKASKKPEPKSDAPNAPKVPPDFKYLNELKEAEDKLKNLKTIGVPVKSLQGWTEQQQTLDAVELIAELIPSKFAKVEKKPKPKRKKEPYDPSTGFKDAPEPPVPTLGECVLQLQIKPKVVLSEKDQKPLPAPAALERTYLAVNSPAVRLQPGSWVRVSAWVRVPADIAASADGVLFFDSADGEGMGVRITEACDWKQIHLYRKVPASGVMWVTVALTGIGMAYFDDIKIEPIVK